MLTVYLLFGLLTGALVNYLADVLPRTRRLSTPIWWPLTSKSLSSYLSSRRVVLVHIVTVGAGYFLWSRPPIGFPVYVLAAILFYFLLVTVIDIEHRVVMHPVSIVGAFFLGLIGFWRHGFVPTVLGGLIGFAAMLSLFYLGELLGRWLAKRRGEPWEDTALGFGDVNLAGVIGLFMGYPGVLAALVSGLFFAGVFSLGYMIWSLLTKRYQPFAAIPYAPFLSLGAVFTILASLY